MARLLRIIFEGATYHLMSRGNGGAYIFTEGRDKAYFVERLGKEAERHEVRVFAYCVMGTHFHILAQTMQANLDKFMQSLLSSYASYMARAGWIGHIFAGRYKSICLNEEEYLLTVGKYIHLNPLEAGLVERPQDYRWSSYRHYCEGGNPPGWLHTAEILECFDRDPGRSIPMHRHFVEGDMDNPFPYPEEKVVARALLGNEEFVKEAMARNKTCLDSGEIAGRKKLLKRVGLDEIYRATCASVGLEGLAVGEAADNKELRDARRLFIHLAKEYTPSTNREIAARLGGIDHRGVSASHRNLLKGLDSDGPRRAELEARMDAALRHIKVPRGSDPENRGQTP